MPVKVSVVMSVYNGEKYVKTAVESILAQTFTDFEFIIINDGSTDGTARILSNYQDARVRLTHQEHLGLTRTLNRGIRMARGEYIARMDVDDISLSERLKKQVDFLEDNPDVGVVGTAYYEIDSEGRTIGRKIFPVEDEELRKALIRYNPLFHGSVMIRKSVFDQVGLYNESFIRAQDYELWFRIARHFKLANLPDLLAMRRYEDMNISVSAEKQQISFAISARIKAIREGQYPWYNCAYLLRPFIAAKSPSAIKKWIRKRILKSRKWS